MNTKYASACARQVFLVLYRSTRSVEKGKVRVAAAEKTQYDERVRVGLLMLV